MNEANQYELETMQKTADVSLSRDYIEYQKKNINLLLRENHELIAKLNNIDTQLAVFLTKDGLMKELMLVHKKLLTSRNSTIINVPVTCTH